MEQMYRKFSSEQVKGLLEKYEKGEVSREAIEGILGIKKAMFFRLISRYREDKERFEINNRKGKSNNNLTEEEESGIKEELAIEKKLIDDERTAQNTIIVI